ncbi:MaoC/PaaZ C-terminal domain-containing protein [Kineococcus indalonis]|uniref:MaoC/PaaZ C-terminal domain-containing protein n=1 Tax=Kineococcus indalonis TaxID=2696566 RepID=UPI001412494D|nr:MaoC/PaaZ C-terminal domain-containing protein [Kineococcus indalonis]NAZ85928.1 acyl dehydratase [Kineococcus indalonis]
MSTVRFEDVRVGDALPAVRHEVTRADLRAYAEASGDRNPIHLDADVARSVGLPDVIAHGMLTMGLAGQSAADWAGDPAAVVRYGTKFTAPVVVPAEGAAVVEVAGTVAARDEDARTVTVDLAVTSAGAKVLGRARAVVRLP